MLEYLGDHADVVELVDSLDLGSNARACRFESCHPHQKRKSHPVGMAFFFSFSWIAPSQSDAR